MLPRLLYNPWTMGWKCHCTTHGPRSGHSVVQPMNHGVDVPLYNPWTMGYKYYPGCCIIHGLWGRYIIVQPMGHGVCILLYNPWSMVRGYPHTHCTTHYPWTINFPWVMGCTMFSSPMVHGLYNALYNVASPMYHGEKVAEPCGNVPNLLLAGKWQVPST